MRRSWVRMGWHRDRKPTAAGRPEREADAMNGGEREVAGGWSRRWRRRRGVVGGRERQKGGPAEEDDNGQREVAAGLELED